jgi:hypothetical protein
LADNYQASQQGIANTAGELGRQATSVQQANAPAPESAFEKLKRAATLPDVRAYAERMQLAADKAVSDVVNLIVAFLLQTLVFPLLLLWLLLRLANMALRLATD